MRQSSEIASPGTGVNLQDIPDGILEGLSDQISIDCGRNRAAATLTMVQVIIIGFHPEVYRQRNEECKILTSVSCFLFSNSGVLTLPLDPLRVKVNARRIDRHWVNRLLGSFPMAKLF
jgi:hypothetical protein